MAINGLLRIAGPFKGSDIEKIAAHFEELMGERVEFEIVEDKSIIGGFKAEISNRIYDACLKTKLDSLREHLVSSNIETNQSESEEA